MNSSANPAAKFWLSAALVYAAALAVGTLAASPAARYAHDQAASYADDALHQVNAATSLLELQTAAALDPGNTRYQEQVTKRYMAQGDYNQALASIQNVNSGAAALIRSQAYLEEGRGVAAAIEVQHPTSNASLVQLALCQAVSGDAAQLKKLQAGTNDQDTKKRLLRIGGGGVSLAQELYAAGLYRTTQRALASMPDSSAKSLLLAHTWLNRRPASRENLLAAQDAAEKGTKLDPASLPMHTLLLSIDQQLGDQAAASREQQLLDQLRSGKI